MLTTLVHAEDRQHADNCFTLLSSKPINASGQRCAWAPCEDAVQHVLCIKFYAFALFPCNKQTVAASPSVAPVSCGHLISTLFCQDI